MKITFKKPTARDVFRWIARSAGIALFLLWGAFFLEHLEWFANPDKLPPVWVYFTCLAHMVMLLGFVAAFFNEFAAGVLIIMGGFILFSRAGVMFPIFFTVTSLPAAFFLYDWFSGMKRKGGISAFDGRYILRDTLRWLACIAATFTAVLGAAVWYSGEYLWVNFTFQNGWSVSMSDGYPNPFMMTLSELTVFLSSIAVMLGLTLMWKWVRTGGVMAIIGSIILAAASKSAVVYPLLPAAPLIAVIIAGIGAMSRYLERTTAAQTVS